MSHATSILDAAVSAQQDAVELHGRMGELLRRARRERAAQQDADLMGDRADGSPRAEALDSLHAIIADTVTTLEQLDEQLSEVVDLADQTLL